MLTGDLVRARKKGERIVPRYLDAATRARVLPLARELVGIPTTRVGATRDELEAALEAVGFSARDRVVGLGLRKLILDRCEFAVTTTIEPELLRREVFLEAHAQHRGAGVRGDLNRNAVLAIVGARHAMSSEAVDAALYADLRGSEALTRAPSILVEALLARYDVALAQAMLLRATRVVVTIRDEPPAGLRRLFRAARFHGLLHVVDASTEGAVTITLDGPFSLFDAVQRYGLRLGMFLPSVLACGSFLLRADVLWGKAREPLHFELSNEQGLGARDEGEVGLSPEAQALLESFEKLGSPWSASMNDRVFSLPRETVCIPDLVFTHQKTGESVYLEAFGFWSRDAVFRRVELLRKGFPARVILAVGKHLRVSEEVLGQDDAGEVYVYRSTMSARAILARLDRRSTLESA